MLLGAVEVEAFAGRLEGGHQRLGQVHVGVLAAVAGDGRPVRRRTPRRWRRARAPRSGCRGSRRRRRAWARRAGGRRSSPRRRRGARRRGRRPACWRRPGRCRPPTRSSRRGRASRWRVQRKSHGVVDDLGRAGAAEERADGVGVRHAGGGVDAADGVVGEGLAGAVEVGEAAARVRGALEEGEEVVGAGGEPGAVGRAGRPVAEGGVGRGGGLAHLELSLRGAGPALPLPARRAQGAPRRRRGGDDRGAEGGSRHRRRGDDLGAVGHLLQGARRRCRRSRC